jgi:hypothetical protein
MKRSWPQHVKKTEITIAGEDGCPDGRRESIESPVETAVVTRFLASEGASGWDSLSIAAYTVGKYGRSCQ